MKNASSNNAFFEYLFLVAVASVCLLVSCSRSGQSVSGGGDAFYRFYALGTLCTIRSDIPDLSEIEKYAREEERKYSAFDRDGIVYLINSKAGIEAVHVPQDFLDFMEKVKVLTEVTEGRFNCMIGSVSRLYRNEFGEFCRIPSDDSIDNILRNGLVDISDLIIDRESATVMLKKPGEAIDLGGVAKGLIIDNVAELLKEKGCKRFIINFGGDIRVFGDREYRIGIQDPAGERGEYSQIVTVSNRSVVTSGAYERSFVANGELFHHILDPFTCRPCDVSNGSVTVICEDTVVADALATALFIDPNLERAVREWRDDLEIIFEKT